MQVVVHDCLTQSNFFHTPFRRRLPLRPRSFSLLRLLLVALTLLADAAAKSPLVTGLWLPMAIAARSRCLRGGECAKKASSGAR